MQNIRFNEDIINKVVIAIANVLVKGTFMRVKKIILDRKNERIVENNSFSTKQDQNNPMNNKVMVIVDLLDTMFNTFLK